LNFPALKERETPGEKVFEPMKNLFEDWGNYEKPLIRFWNGLTIGKIGLGKNRVKVNQLRKTNGLIPG